MFLLGFQVLINVCAWVPGAEQLSALGFQVLSNGLHMDSRCWLMSALGFQVLTNVCAWVPCTDQCLRLGSRVLNNSLHLDSVQAGNNISVNI